MGFPESLLGFPTVVASCWLLEQGQDFSHPVSSLEKVLIFPLSCLLSLVPKFFYVLGFRIGTPQEGLYQLCIYVNLQLQWWCVLCLCWTGLVLTIAAEKVLREVAIWAIQYPHKDLIKTGLLLCSLSWSVALWSIQVPTPETWESSLTFPSLPSSG